MRRATLREQLERRHELETIRRIDRTSDETRELADLDRRRRVRLSAVEARILFTRQKLARLEAIAARRQDEA